MRHFNPTFHFIAPKELAMPEEYKLYCKEHNIKYVDEGRIPLAEAVVYLATSPKSNSAYLGINDALATVRQTGNLPVPLHIRNAPTTEFPEMKEF